TFSPVAAHTANLVGNFYLAGNAGFMRQQAGYAGKFGPVEAQLALGMPGSNNTAGVANLGFGAIPTFALRVGYRLRRDSWVCVSGIATGMGFTNPATPRLTAEAERRVAWGANAFADLTFGTVNLRAKGYVGQNLANTGTLTLAGGRFGADVRDAGGFIA